jgi:hypothetical protein
VHNRGGQWPTREAGLAVGQTLAERLSDCENEISNGAFACLRCLENHIR